MENFNLRTSLRKKAKIKMALQGPSGSGKTYSALLLAFGLTNDWKSIAVIDTENHSADLYAHLGPYNVLDLSPPFSPERYIEAIKACEKQGIKVLIIDSISHEWDGVGGILDIHGNMMGNSFTNWAKVTPRHNAFVQTILQSNIHTICTIRSKQDYVLSEKNGKMVPEKIGLKGVTREGLDYEFTIVLEIDIKHNATASKDRTQMFVDKPEFKISESIGKRILTWCESGQSLANTQTNFEAIVMEIQNAPSINELELLYRKHGEQSGLIDTFKSRKSQLIQQLNNQRNGTQQ